MVSSSPQPSASMVGIGFSMMDIDVFLRKEVLTIVSISMM